jgi:hypothetical protein
MKAPSASALLLTAASAIRPRLKNTKPLCKDCKYYIANEWDCGKFGDVNLVTGKESFQSASSVRNDETKCGKEAKHFEHNRLKIITVPYYFLLNYWTLMPAFGIAVFYFYQVSQIWKH